MQLLALLASQLVLSSCDCAPPARLKIGEDGFVQPGAMIQLWTTAERRDDVAVGLRLRRAELSLKGEIVKDMLAFDVMVDPSRLLEFKAFTSGSPSEPMVAMRKNTTPLFAVQDAWLKLQTPVADVTVGQFRTLMSMEGTTSAAQLPLAERSVSARFFGDRRDLGAKIGKKHTYVGWTAAIFNGSNLGSFAWDSTRDASLRFEVYPVKGLVVGTAMTASLADPNASGSRALAELDLRIEQGPLFVQAELLGGRAIAGNGVALPVGGHALAGLTLFEKFQPVLRVGAFTPNARTNLKATELAKIDPVVEVGAGLNYLPFGKTVKLHTGVTQLQYQRAKPVTQFIAAAQFTL